MLLPEKTGEYTFPSNERDHPLYISIYSADCLRIPLLPTQDRRPGSVSSIEESHPPKRHPGICGFALPKL